MINNKLCLSNSDTQWSTHTLTVGYRKTGNTGHEYGYLANTIGALVPPDDQKLIAKYYKSPSDCYFVSYTNSRVDGYIAFSPTQSDTFHFSYKDNRYDNKAVYERMVSFNGKTIPIYVNTVPPTWYSV